MPQPAGKFRKKPVIIEAMLYDGTVEGGTALLDWADDTVSRVDPQTIRVKTLEGSLIVSPGDWLVKGIAGEFYPVRSDIFTMTYEPVN